MTCVLLIDSEQMFLECLSHYLQMNTEGLEIQTAANGEAGWDLVLKHEPMLVILDWELPGLHGFDLLHRIQQHELPCKVLFVSCYLSACVIHQAITGGAAGFLAKQDPLSELIQAIPRVLEGRKFYSSRVREFLVGTANLNEAAVQPELLLTSFSELQFVVFRYLAQGLKIQEIAERVGLSHSAVESHTYRIMKKLNLANRPELTRFALREGLATL